MGGASSRYGKREVDTGIWWGSLMEQEHLEDPGVEGRVI